MIEKWDYALDLSFLYIVTVAQEKKSHCWSSQFNVSIFPTELEVLWVMSDPPPILKPTVSNSELKTQIANNTEMTEKWEFHGVTMGPCSVYIWNEIPITRGTPNRGEIIISRILLLKYTSGSTLINTLSQFIKLKKKKGALRVLQIKECQLSLRKLKISQTWGCMDREGLQRSPWWRLTSWGLWLKLKEPRYLR